MFRRMPAALLLPVANVLAGMLAAGMPEMCSVPGGGQPNGPEYTFLMSKYEITNRQFTIFLNEERAACMASAEPDIVFDAFGNAFLGRSEGREIEMQSTYWRLFSINNMHSGTQSGIEYRDGRYAAVAGREEHPVVGVNWFGAVRYCNWLTVRSGLGEGERCYSDGPNSKDWHPAHVRYHQWIRRFTTEQCREWVEEFRG